MGFLVFDYDTYKHLVGNGTLKLVERALPEKLRSEENIKKYHAEFSEERQYEMCEQEPSLMSISAMCLTRFAMRAL